MRSFKDLKIAVAGIWYVGCLPLFFVAQDYQAIAGRYRF